MIVHVFNSSVVSGPETLVIPALGQFGEKATVIFLSETRKGDKSSGPPAYARSFGLDAIEITVRKRWDRAALAELSAALERLAPSVVHAHEVKASAYVGAAASPTRKYRLVTTNHGVNAKMNWWLLKLYEWVFTHWVMRKFDRVLCVCTSDRQLLINAGVPAEKILVHLNGVTRPKVAFEHRAQASSEIRKAWGLPDRGVGKHALVLGLVGRLAPEKRHSYILHSFKKLREQHPELDVHLVIFGIGALEAELIAETATLKLQDRVHWMGYRGTVGAESVGFDLLISLSRAEGLPINIVEAGWAATPVYATSVDGNLDLVPSREYGTLVDPAATEQQISDSLAHELADRVRLAGTGARLQERIEKYFSETTWIARLREVYHF